MGIALTGKRFNLWRMSALRQALVLTGVFMLVLLLAGVTMWRMLNSAVEAQLNDTLTYLSEDIQDAIAQDGLDAALAPVLDHDAFSGDIAGFLTTQGEIRGEIAASIFSVLGQQDVDETVLFGPIDVEDIDPELTEFLGEDDSLLDGTEIWRVQVTQLPQGRLAVATPRDQIDLIDAILPAALVFTGLLMALITLIGGVVFGLIAQRRLSRMTTQLEHIAQGDLTQRLAPAHVRDDLDHLAVRIDDTTARLDQVMTQTKALSVSIAHDLRLPLARLRTRLEDAQNAADPAHDMAEALTETDQLVDIFDTIMRIAGFQSGAARARFEPVDLGALAEATFEIFAPVFEDAHQNLRLEFDNPATVQGDRQALMQALANLLQNARIHSFESATVTLFARGNTIGVRDHGPGIPADQREAVQRMMVRLDAARTSPGAGLGLALVRAVADLHSADLRLRDSQPQPPHGLTATLAFG